MSSDGDLLLAAILANPREDTPRLMLADWLDENGEPERAEFIRAGVELARTLKWADSHDAPADQHDQSAAGPRRPNPRHEELDARVRDLLNNHGAAWAGPILTADAAEGRRLFWRWERGFVWQLKLPVPAALRHAKPILAAHPVHEWLFPRFHLAIKPPDADHGWRLSSHPNGHDARFALAADAPTREELIERFVAGVRDLRGEPA